MAGGNGELERILRQAREAALDPTLGIVRRWKEAHPQVAAVGSSLAHCHLESCVS